MNIVVSAQTAEESTDLEFGPIKKELTQNVTVAIGAECATSTVILLIFA